MKTKIVYLAGMVLVLGQSTASFAWHTGPSNDDDCTAASNKLGGTQTGQTWPTGWNGSTGFLSSVIYPQWYGSNDQSGLETAVRNKVNALSGANCGRTITVNEQCQHFGDICLAYPLGHMVKSFPTLSVSSALCTTPPVHNGNVTCAAAGDFCTVTYKDYWANAAFVPAVAKPIERGPHACSTALFSPTDPAVGRYKACLSTDGVDSLVPEGSTITVAPPAVAAVAGGIVSCTTPSCDVVYKTYFAAAGPTGTLAAPFTETHTASLTASVAGVSHVCNDAEMNGGSPLHGGRTSGCVVTTGGVTSGGTAHMIPAGSTFLVKTIAGPVITALSAAPSSSSLSTAVTTLYKAFFPVTITNPTTANDVKVTYTSTVGPANTYTITACSGTCAASMNATMPTMAALACGTSYHVKAVATAKPAGGVYSTKEIDFSTPPCAVTLTLLPATSVGTSTANLMATMTNPQAASTVSFSRLLPSYSTWTTVAPVAAAASLNVPVSGLSCYNATTNQGGYNVLANVNPNDVASVITVVGSGNFHTLACGTLPNLNLSQ